MYITDLKHFLDGQGALGPAKGPARAMAQFQTDVVAYATCATCATDTTVATPEAPTCFKCKKSPVEVALARDEAVVWKCPRCETEGRISNWQGTLWDLRDRPAPRA
jgi:hypothetical protein